MATRKLYIGRKIRGIRHGLQTTQANFAERLGVSTSYLNQIENNQRPVSAAVLLALAENFQIDIGALSLSDDDRMLSALTEALADPVFENYRPSLHDLKLVTQNAPALARALISCHQAYRKSTEQLAGLDETLLHSSVVEPTPYEEVRDFFHFVDNYVHELDAAAERLALSLDVPGREAGVSFGEHLAKRHGVRIMRTRAGDDIVRQFDREARVLLLNPYAALATRTFQTAFQIASLEMHDSISGIIERAGFRSIEAREICRIGLNNYYAGALMLPYHAFMSAAKELRHDLELLSARFGASFEQISHRLSTLQRPGFKGTPVFFATVDRAGNITKRHSAAKFQFARFGAACPLWNAHRAFESPGQIVRQLAETPDGVRYLSVAVEVTKSGGGYRGLRRSYAIVIGCEISRAGDFVYSDGLDIHNKTAYDPIGISCRICERTECRQRAVPPLKQRIEIDHDLRRGLPYRLN